MCVILLLIFALFVLGLVLVSMLAVGSGCLIGASLGTAVGVTRSESRTPVEGKLDADRGAALGGCLGAMFGLIAVATFVSRALSPR